MAATTTTTTTTITTTYHNQLGGEVSALSTDVGDVPTGLEESLAVATSLGARHPDALLRLVRLVLVRLLHVHAGKQELGGIGLDRTLHQLDVARHDGAKGNLQY